MKTNRLFSSIACAILSVFALVSCSQKEFDVVTEMDLARCLQPMNLNARVLSAYGDVVNFTWDVTKDADYYMLTIYTDSDYKTQYIPAEKVDPSNVPYQKKLEPDGTFYYTVQAFSDTEGREPSKIARYGKKISTFAVAANLYLKVSDRTSKSVTLAWSKNVEDYLNVDRIDYGAPGFEEPEGSLTLTGTDAIASATAVVDGLEPGKEYEFILYYKTAQRGRVNVWTQPSTDGLTPVTTAEGLKNALATPGAKILLKMDGSPYEIASFDLVGGVSIIGEGAADGSMPVVSGEFNVADAWTAGNDTYFEGVEFSGYGTAANPSGFGFVFQKKNGGTADGLVLGNVTFKNCNIIGYTKGLFYEWGKTVKVGKFLFDSCLIDRNNEDGTGGGDGFDLRYESTFDELSFVNNTISNGYRTFIRNYPQTEGNPSATITKLTFNNNTVHNLCFVDGTNNTGIFGIRTKPGSFEMRRNLFLNMVEKSTLVNSSKNLAMSDMNLTASDNWFYGCVATFFNDYGKLNMVAGKELKEDPCYNAAGGYFNLLPDAEITGAGIGASKWWTPFVEEPEDLTMTTIGAHTWDLSDARYFFGSIKKFMVRDALLIAGSEERPIVAEEGVLKFGGAAVTDRKGMPQYNYLAFQVDKPGSVIIKAKDPSDLTGHIVVGVGPKDGSSIAIKGGVSATADMENAQKILITSIAEESLVYIYPSGAISLEKLAWSEDVTPVNTALPTPEPAAEPASFTAGEATDVVISWEPVNGAGSYSVVFNGKTYTVNAEPWSFTIGGTTTAMLDAGSYKVEVYANPDSGDIYNTESAAGVTAFAVLPKASAGEDVELVVKSVDELNSAIAAGKTVISLAPGTYDIGTLTTVKDLHLKKQTGVTDRPVLNGSVKIVGLDQGNLLFEGLEFAGSSTATNAFTVSNVTGDSAETDVAAESLTIRDCVIRDYSKSVIYNPKGNKTTPESVIGSLVLENNIIKDCTTGQNTIDIRDGHYDEIRILENTFVNCAVTGADVFRIDDGQNGLVECSYFTVENNTFYNSGAASGKAIFYVRESFSTYKVMNNLFIGADGAAGKYSRSTVVMPQLKNNFFYNVGANWFTGDITADGTTLTTNPVKNAASGDFTLVSALLMSVRAGASRWNPSQVPDTGSSFEVHNAEELTAALSAGKTDLVLAAGDYEIGTLLTVPGLRLTGAAGAKPVLTGAVKIAGENLGTIVLDNLKFVGSSSATNAFTVNNKTGDSGTVDVVSATSVVVKNCDISGYSKSVFYVPKGNKTTPESDIASLTFDNCLITDCTTGQNTIDVRDGRFGIITIQNCTFVNCAVSGAEVIRMDNTQNGLVECNGLVVRGNTFYNCAAASGKSLFYVREDLATYSITRNLFIGSDAAAGLFARARVALGETYIAPTLKENFFFAMGANIFGEKDDIKEGFGTILSESPVKDAANGDYTLTNTLVMSCNAGAARWNPAYGTTSPSDFFTVTSAQEFSDALSAGKKNIELAYSATEYALGSVVLTESMNLRGKVTYGKKPVIVGSFKLAGSLGDITLQNLVIKGDTNNSNAITVSNKSGDGAAEDVTGGNVKIMGCDFADYSKSVFYTPKGNKSSPESDIVSVLFTECSFTNCTTGQNTIDIRDGKFGVFTIEKSTFANCAVSGADVFRIDNGQNGLVEMGTFVIKDNTFYHCGAASGKAILYVREDLVGYSVLRNLFVGKEGDAAGLFARARVALGEGYIAPTLEGNCFYGMGGAIFGEKDDIKEGYGTILDTAPCANPEAGDFTTSLNVGDPRWNPASPNFVKKH